jgi:hypothetical protein
MKNILRKPSRKSIVEYARLLNFNYDIETRFLEFDKWLDAYIKVTDKYGILSQEAHNFFKQMPSKRKFEFPQKNMA